MAENETKGTGSEELVLEQNIIYEINLDSVITSWNRGAERLYGWLKNEAVGKQAYELFRTEFHLKMYKFITETIKNYIWTGELSQYKKDGSKITVSSHAILRRDSEGKPGGIIFVNTDITKFKNTEEELKKSEETFAVTLNSIGDGVLSTDYNGIVSYLNPVAEDMTGWTNRQAAGRPVLEVFRIINHDTRKTSALPVKDTLENGTVHGLANHTVLISRNGKEYDIADSCAPIRNREGKVIGAVLVFRDVTDQMAKEAALEKTRKELAITKIAEDAAREYAESLINTVREPMIALDQDLRVVSASRSFYEFFRVKPADTVGKLIYNLGNKQWDIPKLRKLLETILPEKSTFDNYEVEHEFAYIGRRTMLLNARQIQRVLGKERIILLAMEDVTQRTEAEYLLERINRILRAISNTNQELMHEKDEQAYMDKVCKIAVKDCGLKMAWVGFAGNDEKKSIVPVSRYGVDEGYFKKIDLTMGNGKSGSNPACRAALTGKTIICRNVMTDSAFAPWRGEAKKRGFMSMIALPFKSINRIFGVFMLYYPEPQLFPDAEIKLLEELVYDLSYGIMLIRIRGEKLTAEQEIKRIAAFPKLNPNPISEIDSTGRIYYINPAFSKLFPDASKETLLHPWFEGIDAIFRRLKGGKKKVIKRDIKVNESYFLQYMVYIPAEGTIRTYGIDITTRKNADDEIKKLYGEMEIKVQQRTTELLASKHLADIGTLAATVAHELRNPLGIINLATYNLRKKVKGPEVLKHIVNIEKKVAESVQIINNLLVYSKMKMPQFEKISLYEIINECAGNAKKHFSNKRILLKKHIGTIKSEMMWADQLQLKEVFTNLITNAYQAMDGKKGAVSIHASLISGKRVSVSVKDTGVGISREDMGNIFKPFFTRKTKGTGLGLVICRDIIAMHDGSINIISKEGKGSTFTVTLPLRLKK